MADVFITYSQKDRDLAQGLADLLNDCGYDVWWDYELVGGVQFRNKIKEELAKARAAIVIWTPSSVESDWVIEEAEEAKHEHKLVATRIDGFDYRAIPLGFRSLHTDLVTAPERILQALERIGVAPSRPPKAPRIVMDKGLNPDAIARAEQFAHWEFIKESNDPAAYAGFVQMFPNSSFAQLARIQLGKLATAAWQKLSESEDVAALEDFVRQFPDDVRAAEAQKRVDALQARAAEEESWTRVKDSADLTAVETHVARFPSGATASAARDLLRRLEHERDVEGHWRAIADGSQADAFERFLTSYPDSKLAAQARTRLDEIRRAHEEQDWKEVCQERHPAPLLRFLKAHPNGARAAEAFEALGALPRTIEREAWSEIRDSNQPIVFQAYLAALPNGKNAKAARAKLKTLAASRAPNAAPVFAFGPPALPDRRKRRKFWTLIGVLGVAVVLLTAIAVANMSNQYAAPGVSAALMTAAIVLALAVLLLFFVVRPLYPDVMDSPRRRSILFHAIGSMAILLWIALTQHNAEPYYSSWSPGVRNVSQGHGVPNLIGLGVVLIAAIGALWTQRLWFAWYALVALIGMIYILSYGSYLGGLFADDYWITTCLNVYGGTALVLLSAAAIVSAWREDRKSAPRASAAASNSAPSPPGHPQPQ
jgi:TIR domain